MSAEEANKEEAIVPSERIRRAILLFALALMAALLYATVHHFIKPVIWAVILSVCSWPVHQRLLRAWPKHPNLAAGFMVLGIALLILLPTGTVTVLMAGEIVGLAQSLQSDLDPERIQATLEAVIPEWLDFVRRDIEPGNGQSGAMGLIPQLGGMLKDSFSGLFANIVNVAFGLAACLFTLFFCFRHGKDAGEQLSYAAYKLGGRRLSEIVMQTRQTVRGVVVGMLVTAMAQAILATASYVAVGLPFPLLLGIVTFFLSFLPIGPPAIWIPASLWLIGMQGETWAGIGLLAWGAGVVSTVDNVLRPMLIGQATGLSVLPVFMGVVGGILSFGMVGLFVGPVVIAVSLALWKDWVTHGPDPLFVTGDGVVHGESAPADPAEGPPPKT